MKKDFIDNSDRFKKDQDANADMTEEAKEMLLADEIPEPPDYSKINLAMQADRILIQQFPHAEKIGHIYTPQNMELPIDKGRVCGIGPDVKTVKVGDIVYKAAGLGQMLMDNQGNKYIFLPEKAVIAIDLFPEKTQEEPVIHNGQPDLPPGVPFD